MAIFLKNLYIDQTNPTKPEYVLVDNGEDKFCSNNKCPTKLNPIESVMIIAHDNFLLESVKVYCSRCYAHAFQSTKSGSIINAYMVDQSELNECCQNVTFDKIETKDSNITSVQASYMKSKFQTNRTRFADKMSIEGASVGVAENIIAANDKAKHLLLDKAANDSNDFKDMINSFAIVSAENQIKYEEVLMIENDV